MLRKTKILVSGKLKYLYVLVETEQAENISVPELRGRWCILQSHHTAHKPAYFVQLLHLISCCYATLRDISLLSTQSTMASRVSRLGINLG
jgi:hypothetical protein